MKKLLLILALFLMMVQVGFAQGVPQGINYQAVARDSAGNLISNKNIGLRFSIRDISASGVIVYRETQTVTTNELGLFSIVIGQGSIVSGTFSSIDWGISAKFLQVELDVDGGTSYTDMGTQQMLSVPYALYSGSSVGGWNINGNAGTTDSSSFIGTTDDVPLNFKVNNEKAGRIDRSLLNTFFGYQAGKNNAGIIGISGYGNTAFGHQSLSANTTGFGNVAIGHYSLSTNTTGGGNTAVGGSALWQNSTGSINTAFGFDALKFNSEGNANTAVGVGSLHYNTGSENTAFGYGALYWNSVGVHNTAIGQSALERSQTGSFNTALGLSALFSNIDGNSNTAIGYFAGSGSTYLGSGNVFLGYEAGRLETGSNKLYIANNDVNPPLIYGDFATKKLGLGTIDPTATLHVAGNVRIEDGTQGLGKVLTSDADGIASWQPSSTSGSTAHYIGENYGGGIVFYIYDGGQHGLIGAASDQAAGIPWYNGIYKYTGTTGDGLNAGAMNTALIIASQIADNTSGNFAAKACADYSITVGGITYGDWYLPSIWELNMMVQQISFFGSSFSSNNYWSSTEVDGNNAYREDPHWATGYIGSNDKNNAINYGVRAIRAF